MTLPASELNINSQSPSISVIDTSGEQVMRLTRAKLRSAVKYKDGMIKDADSYRTKTVPVAGTLYDEDTDQLKFV